MRTRTFRNAQPPRHRDVGRIVWRAAATAVAVAALATPLEAQLIKVPSMLDVRAPVALAASVGYVQTGSRADGPSGTTWALSDAVQYRLGLERGMRSGLIGVAVSMTEFPVRRVGAGVSPTSDGTVRLLQYLATFRTPETPGAHQIIELSTGLAQWGNYSGTDVLTAAEAKTQNAWALQIGYGFGFSLSDRTSVTLVQDLATVIGSKDGLQAGESRSVRQYTTRLGLRWRFRGRM